MRRANLSAYDAKILAALQQLEAPIHDLRMLADLGVLIAEQPVITDPAEFRHHQDRSAFLALQIGAMAENLYDAFLAAFEQPPAECEHTTAAEAGCG